MLVRGLAFVAFGCLLAGCQAPGYTGRGAAMGGLTGAGVGAAIGNSHGDTAAGALLGGAVGALTGAAIGGSLDEVNQRNQALIEERLGRPVQGATPIHDVVAMSQAGLNDEVIIQHLRVHGLASPLSAQDLIALKQQGVSNSVIQAMQELVTSQAIVPGAAPAVVAYPEPPLIVEQYHYVPQPGPFCPPYPPYFRHPRHGYHWGVSVGR